MRSIHAAAAAALAVAAVLVPLSGTAQADPDPGPSTHVAVRVPVNGTVVSPTLKGCRVIVQQFQYYYSAYRVSQLRVTAVPGLRCPNVLLFVRGYNTLGQEVGTSATTTPGTGQTTATLVNAQIAVGSAYVGAKDGFDITVG